MHRMTWKVSHSHALDLLPWRTESCLDPWQWSMIIPQSVLLIISLLLLQMPAEALLPVLSVHAFELVFEGCTYTRAWLHDLESATHTHDSADPLHQLVLLSVFIWLNLLIDYCMNTDLGRCVMQHLWGLQFYFWTGNFIFPKAIYLIWQGLLQQYACIFQSKQKIKLLCPYARMGAMCVLTWEKQWGDVHVCVSKFQMYSIYQPR